MRRFFLTPVALPIVLAGVLWAGPAAAAPLADGETLNLPGGKAIAGTLVGTPDRGTVFREAGGGKLVDLEAGMSLRFKPSPPGGGAGLPPFRVDLGLGQRLSGRVGSVDDGRIVLQDVGAGQTVTIERAGVNALLQRPGESLTFLEGFETLDTGRWAIEGPASLAGEPRKTGELSLRLPAGGASLTHKLPDPFDFGRCDTAFFDGNEAAAGDSWSLTLTFRSPNGPQRVRTVLGWADPSLAVESPDGPTMAVQRLARSPGWHRLTIRFSPDRFEIAVDGDELAHGKGVSGPLTELTLASARAPRTVGDAPSGLTGYFDDLRLVRFNEPTTDVEIDAGQDEVRLTNGDQLFGKVSSAGPEAVEIEVDGRTVRLPWSEASGVYFRRDSQAGKAVKGPLVRAHWRVGPDPDPREDDRVEGALTDVSESTVSIATPYAGTLTIPRARLTLIDVLGRGTRLLIDPKAHHLGDEVTLMPPVIDPPQPEGGVLERSFELPALGQGDLELVMDVVGVVGEAADLPFARLVQKGELRTNVAINGAPFDYLNRHIKGLNETPERIRMTVPKDQLRPGTNVIRLEQVGIANDPNYLDDLGILGIAVEVTDRPKGGR